MGRLLLVYLTLSFHWVGMFAEPDFARREQAQRKLSEMGYLALPAATAGSFSLDFEVKYRSKKLCGGLAKEINEWLWAFWLLATPDLGFSGMNGWDIAVAPPEVYWKVAYIAYVLEFRTRDQLCFIDSVWSCNRLLDNLRWYIRYVLLRSD